MPEAHSTTNTPGAANTTRSCSLRGMNADTPNCPMPGPILGSRITATRDTNQGCGHRIASNERTGRGWAVRTTNVRFVSKADILHLRQRRTLFDHLVSEGLQIRLCHSTILSAKPTRDSGRVRLTAFAVRRFITSSTFSGCHTGRSDGFAPLRTLAT